MPTRRLVVLLVVFQWILTYQAQSSAVLDRLARPKPEQQGSASLFPMLPLAFEPNRGQVPGPARFVAHAGGYELRVMDTEIAMALNHRGEPSSTILVGFVSAREPLLVSGSGLLPGKSNYYIGPQWNWHIGVPQYKAVSATQVYPGIDVLYYGNQRQLEFDFVVAPGAAADRIRLRLQGSTEVVKDSAGNLVVGAGENKVVFERPLAYQDDPVGRHIVDARYEVNGSDVRIRLGAYDRSRQLTIDPVLSYATFLGGSGLDTANGVATDAPGNAYVAGQTCSATGLPNPLNTYTANCDAYMTAVSADGTAALYTTYLGGSNADGANAIAARADGTVAAVGITNSDNFPITTNAYQSTYNGGDNDAFVSVLDPTGHLTYSSYLGGSHNDVANGVLFDDSANIIVVGQTGDMTGVNDFPVTGGPVFNPLYDGFITDLAASTGYSTLVFSEYFPVSTPPTAPVACDGINAVALDLLGDIYVGGTTIPSCQVPGNRTAFAAKIAKADPFGLVYGWISLNKPSQGLGIAVDSFGDAVLVGSQSNGALIWKINPLGSDFLFSKVIADSSTANGVAVDDNGFIYIAGTTSLATFPLVSPTQAVLAGAEDGFLLKMDPTGTATLFSTFFGGGGSDFGNAIALSSENPACGSAGGSRCIYVAGITYSADLPVSSAIQSAYGGNGDAFLGKWTGVNLPYATLSCSAPDCPVQINFGDQAVGTTSAAQTITLKNLGDAPLEIYGINASGQFAQTHDCGTFLQPNTTCTINATFVPTSTGIQTGAITVVDNASSGSQSVSLTGNGTSGGGGGGGGGGGNFTLALSPSSATVVAGKSATFTLTVTPSGLSSKLSAACSGLPATMSCSFSPSTLSVSGSSPVTVTVTVGTQARAALRPGPFARPTFLAQITALSFGLMGVIVLAGSRRSSRSKTLMICGLLLLFATLNGCGGTTKDIGSGTQAGTYTMTITVTATEVSPPLSVSTQPVTVVVQ